MAPKAALLPGADENGHFQPGMNDPCQVGVLQIHVLHSIMQLQPAFTSRHACMQDIAGVRERLSAGGGCKMTEAHYVVIISVNCSFSADAPCFWQEKFVIRIIIIICVKIWISIFQLVLL